MIGVTEEDAALGKNEIEIIRSGDPLKQQANKEAAMSELILSTLITQYPTALV